MIKQVTDSTTIDGTTEIETEVSDPHAMAEILRTIGLRVVRYQENYREEWRLGEVAFDFDTWPRALAEVPGPLPASGVIHIVIPHTDRFTVVGNHLAQHPDLSCTAIGIAVRIQSLPQGVEVSIKALAARCREGEKRIAAGLRELEALGYLQRVRERLPSGRVITRTVFCNQPTALLHPRSPAAAPTPPQPPTPVPAPAPATGQPMPPEPPELPGPSETPAPEAPAPLPVPSGPPQASPSVPLPPPLFVPLVPPPTAHTAHTEAKTHELPPPDLAGAAARAARAARPHGFRHSEKLESEGNCALWWRLSDPRGAVPPPGPGIIPRPAHRIPIRSAQVARVIVPPWQPPLSVFRRSDPTQGIM
ncbi:hypothetical protein ACIQRW_22030 [Streptomyces sp. NPDC091287]|uniref:hypothetical protein n=1 Tax=Streptomyces sp. NPDC091287 TaxID=3365988 RepID=UPI0038214634